jgi:hypothetical protein
MFETLTKRNKLKKAKQLFLDAADRDQNWQMEAREDFAFRDGNQWTKEEKQILEEELRPALTFNLTKSHIDLIMGMNEENRIVHRATPIEKTDTFLAEVLNDIASWVQENNNFTAEEDGALESAAICGRGYVAIDFVPDPDNFGEIIMTEVDVPVHEVHFDPASRRPNLEDASYITWDRWLTREDFKIRYPKLSSKKIDILMETGTNYGLSSAAKDIPQGGFDLPQDDDRDDDYTRPLDFNFFDKRKNMLRVVHMEYWDTYKRWFAYNPDPNVRGFVEIPKMPTKEQKEAYLAEFGKEMTYEYMMDKRVKWLQFIGEDILYDDVSPLPYKGFSIVPMFAYRDISKRSMNHFGVVRLMKDPQKEINKRWSQALNMLNQQVQPGVYAETDAFVDQRQAEQSLKEAGSITWVNAGSLAGGKLKEREVPKMPNAPMQMQEFSKDIMKQITGINPDLLGQDRGRQEAGVVIRLRQQQGTVLLRPLFRAYNEMKKQLFMRQLSIIMSYMPTPQVMKILGQNERYSVDKSTGDIVDNLHGLVAPIRAVQNLEYNIATEQAPGNMSQRMLELTALLEMSQQMPVPPEQIIDKLELPASDKAQWLAYIQQQQMGMQEQQQQMVAMEAQFKDREIKVDEQRNMLEFMVDMAKIKQMAEKDEKKMVSDFSKLSVEQQSNILQFAAQMAQVAATATANKEQQKKQGEKK